MDVAMEAGEASTDPSTDERRYGGALRVPAEVLEEAELVLNQRIALLDERDTLLGAFERLEKLDRRAGQRVAAAAVYPPPSGGVAAVVALVDKIELIDTEIDQRRRTEQQT
jgi:hypothetical protein